MNTIKVFFEGDLAHALGWTLVHSVWQGAVITAIVSVALVGLRRRSANVRYLVASLGLCAMLVVPVVTYSTLVDGSTVQSVVQNPNASTVSGVAPPSVYIADTVANSSGESPWTALPLLVAIWFVGVFVLSLHVLAGWSYTQVLKRRTTCEVPEPWRARMSELAMEKDALEGMIMGH